ncbi:hydrogenase nickel incorporation protein HypB [Photobacterium jeanii]|uniref:hydrogenase nickel incorporation protein HypB n=1 Tax=Photobacterium jeanii TaxID=858640 RepID=UPI000A02F8D0|nr:hydrogenase nickel incorporation protein HypB [Photobacterium jeanii]PST90825.1 hydrogenase nickel incorporation protein HypB [Photobacterium jeanii]
MCNVCGCGDSQIEQVGHDHHGHHHGHHHPSHHDHSHAHHHGEAHHQNPQPVVVHHHYHHQGDVHHHHYHYPESQQHHSQEHPHSHQHSHAHHHNHNEAHHDHHADHHHAHQHELTPEQSEQGDLHYGKGEAETHVAGVSQRKLIEIEMDVLSKNNHLASHNREHFEQDNQLVLNLVSSPGSGKTTLLTETLNRLQQQSHHGESRACAVIEGDQQTTNDAERIRQTGVPAIQVNTGKGCHLDAKMVHDACHQLELQTGGVLFIENVGNLVCPASFDLGEKYKVAILSVTEGEDKPLKYPNMFAAAQLMIINKIDLLPYVAFDVEACIANARKVNPYIQVIKLSATSGEGMEAWLDWLNNA